MLEYLLGGPLLGLYLPAAKVGAIIGHMYKIPVHFIQKIRLIYPFLNIF
jgi:hypothetical protein